MCQECAKPSFLFTNFVLLLVTVLCFVNMEAAGADSKEAINVIDMKDDKKTNCKTTCSEVADETTEHLQLPPAEGVRDEDSGGTQTLDLGKGSKDLTDELGPLVINKDGTTARITNWHKMTMDEKERTLRIITKRNRERLAVLKQGLKTEL